MDASVPSRREGTLIVHTFPLENPKARSSLVGAKRHTVDQSAQTRSGAQSRATQA
jgi:hypothetical protein